MNTTSSQLQINLFALASFLTDPVCKTREWYWRSRVTADLGEKVLFLFGVLLAAVAALVVTIPAIVIRYAAVRMARVPYLHVKGNKSALASRPDSFSLLSWNVCFIPAGYSITDGGVTPWKFRINRIVENVKTINADVVCLYEVFDFGAVSSLVKKLSDSYCEFYVCLGSQGLGASSGFFVASKYEITNPEFIRFPKESRVGRTQFVAKGFFAFDLSDSRASFARIYATHLQHSEECMFPTMEEIASREFSMQLIMDHMEHRAVVEVPVLLVGDLNLDEQEYDASDWKNKFDENHFFAKKTWGGDEFCAKLVGKKVSPPLDLDYMLIKKNRGRVLHTSIVETGYDPKIYKSEALSDHEGLLGKVVIDREV